MATGDVTVNGVVVNNPRKKSPSAYRALLTAALTALAGTSVSITVAAGVASYVVATEAAGSGVVRQVTLTLTALPLTITDALAYLGTKLADFPDGDISILGGTFNLVTTTTSTIATTLKAGVTMGIAVGTATATNKTLATTMIDLIPGTGQSVPTGPTSTVINVAPAAIKARLIAAAKFDGTTTAKAIYLNIGIPTDTDIDGNATVTVSGTIKLTYVAHGDY